MSRATTFTFYSNVNLSLRTNDNFYFADRAAQTTFFASKAVLTVGNCYYQRANKGRVKVERSYSSLYKCDYLSFINPDYENKRFYAYITAVNYISDTTTEVEYTIDIIQTWLLDCNFRPCFIERNHANRDHFGDNILPDSVECGESIIDSVTNSIPTNTFVVVLATFDVIEWIDSNFTNKVAPTVWVKDGIYDALSQVVFFAEIQGQQALTGSALSVFFEKVFQGAGSVTVDDIVNIYLYPSIGITTGTAHTVPGASQGNEFNEVYQVTNARHEQVTLPTMPTQIDGYTPKNNKLFTYPYCFIHVENNNGSAIDLKYERFKDGRGNIINPPKAEVFGTTTGEAKLRLVPKQYFGALSTEFDFDYAIDTGSYPTISMLGDAYNIYLAQNKNTVANDYDMLRNKTSQSIVAAERKNLASKDALGMLLDSMNIASNFLDNIATMQAKYDDMKLAPATAKGVTGVGLSYQHDKEDFTMVVKTLDYTHARIVDDYFTMFGYPVRRIGVPMLRARTAFTYVKTVGCVITGNVPEEAKATIEGLFDAGIRLWSNQSEIGNFNVINDPINS